MKNEFRGFYSLEESELKKLWENACFVFDTNVLLNLYRYHENTTEQLIGVLEQLKDRIWIPYHVALEYQRNRLTVIATQNSKFSEVRKLVSKGTSSINIELENLNLKKRHSSIEPDGFMKSIETATNEFLNVLDQLEKDHFSVVGEDQIRVRLDLLLDGKIGEKPASQEEIDKLEDEAELRFNHKIPPGYMDDDKETSDTPVFSYGGMTYRRKYSDYIVWSQLLSHANKSSITDLVFITDDQKEDWWLKVKQNGVKTISPRPELMGEIGQKTEVERFHMYSSEGFLKYANELLNAGISNEAIEEVRDKARASDKGSPKHVDKTRNMERSAVQAVHDWLSAMYGEENLVIAQNSPVDIVASVSEKSVAYEIKVVRNSRDSFDRVRQLAYVEHYHREVKQFDKLVFVLVAFDLDRIEKIRRALETKSYYLPSMHIILGVAKYDESSGVVSSFDPCEEFKIGSSRH